MNRFLSFVITAVLVFVAVSCDDYISPPYPGHTWLSNITIKSARATSRIVLEGDAGKQESGFCWNTKGFPTIDDFHTVADIKGNLFSADIIGLSEGTKYYIRSYAKNRGGVLYGQVKSFVTVTTKLPTVNSPSFFTLTHDKVFLLGGGVEDNSFDILSRGICWSTTGIPTLNDHCVENGNGFEGFSCNLDLEPGTVYYYRAWATNSAGTSYGGTRAIRTLDGFTTDFEGHVYSTVKIGRQEWLIRNLEATRFSNGDPVNTTQMPGTNIEQMDKPVFQWGFLGFDYHMDDHGRLYTWYVATDTRNICPDGWHVPSKDEWNELLQHLGGDTLRSFYFTQNFNFDWNNRFNIRKTEGSFWPAQPGTRTPAGQFLYHSHYGSYWWAATEESPSEASAVYFGPSDIDLVRLTRKDKKNGFSIRCVKD